MRPARLLIHAVPKTGPSRSNGSLIMSRYLDDVVVWEDEHHNMHKLGLCFMKQTLEPWKA
jgi:hypothetical protein